MKHEYQIVFYELWGNSKDGYEVNDTFPTSETVIIGETATDEEIVKILTDYIIGLDSVNISDICIDGEPEYTLYVELNGKPFVELRNIDN
jgi:hypothetical protein